ncbi:MAG: hypothetical protein L0Y73_06245, partial [Candidatus Aminicenantes bacterium]|nr:hypothetical protein [Candidatus Aminicenantes bacterium]
MVLKHKTKVKEKSDSFVVRKKCAGNHRASGRQACPYDSIIIHSRENAGEDACATFAAYSLPDLGGEFRV